MLRIHMCSVCAVIVAVSLLSIGLTGCGGGGGTGPVLEPARAGFSVHFWPESLLDQASVQDVRTAAQERDGSWQIEVKAEEAKGLKAIYFDLEYDANRFTPTEASLSSQFSGGLDVLELFKSDEPGKLYYGAVIANYPQHEGVSGELVLATLHFIEQPHKGTKHDSAAPTSAESAARLEWDGDTGVFSWGYSSQGDYDQNGETNIADLSPLGRHFHKAGDFEYNSIEAVIDGDGNGEINIADISPIGMNFQNVVEGYVLCASEQESDCKCYLTNPGHLASLRKSNLPLDNATGNQGAGRLSFAEEYPSPQADCYYWVHPAHGDSYGVNSNTVYMPQVNLYPEASFTASVLGGDAPLTVEFDASASSDPDGTITEYAWDWDGPVNGLSFEGAGANPSASHIYTAAGEYTPVLRVVDDEGAEQTATGDSILVTEYNEEPTAALTADPTAGVLPLTVELDAGGSTDTDGTIVKYEFDPEGDGVFETDNGGLSLISYEYTTAGIFQAQVRVTDNKGATDTSSATVSVSAIPAVLALTNPPALGQGIETDPYVVATDTVLYFTMTHPVDGDVTSSSVFNTFPNTGVWNAPGEWLATTECMLLYIRAEYDGTVCATEDFIYIKVSNAQEGVFIRPIAGHASWNAPTTGSGTEEDPFRVGGSFETPREYPFEANSMSDFSGDLIDPATLSWHAAPEFMVNWPSPGVMVPTAVANGPVYANDGSLDSNLIYIAYVESYAPTALLLSDSYIGTAPFAVTLDATGSSDPENEPLLFEFDLDADGVFEVNNGTDPTLDWTFSPAGLHDLALRVSDPSGKHAEDYCMLVVETTPTLIQPDMIYTLPDRSQAQEGDIVTVTVFCNLTANPFLYLNGVRLTWAEGSPFNGPQFGGINAGERGGADNAIDGVWTLIGNSNFMGPLSSNMVTGGLVVLDTNATPTDGSAASGASGALYNFEIEIHSDLVFSIVRVAGVDRTYYSAESGSTHYWTHDTNAGFPGVLVTP